MTTPETINSHNPLSVPWRHRIIIHVTAGFAGLLATLKPVCLRQILLTVRRGARHATHAETLAVRQRLVAVSLVCTGPQSCLARSIAVALLCRINGSWPTWCTGVRRIPPFGAHAWVEAEGRSVGEPYPDGYHVTMLSVPPAANR
ncbi:MAG: lasso peptide biosynthesis B2 protein [Kibdelosporangium sp.]